MEDTIEGECVCELCSLEVHEDSTQLEGRVPQLESELVCNKKKKAKFKSLMN